MALISGEGSGWTGVGGAAGAYQQPTEASGFGRGSGEERQPDRTGLVGP